MKEIILTHLDQIEAVENIKIVYACESGSRAWGFPSVDSDYDVRFLYVRPVEWYLSIDEKRDVVERPINEGLDINGWDLRKALRLFRKSNPPLLEWLGSPIVYLEKYSVVAKMRDLASVCYSPAACLYHYLHMAGGNFREYLKGEEVWVKKYFYVLRPILAMNWLEKELGVVPTDFNVLVKRLVTEPDLRMEIDRLLAAKRAGAELDLGPRIEPISRFIEHELERWEKYEIENNKLPAFTDKLDELFRESLAEVWPS
ncbi:MAG: nucleotidyltransferase domain-containing protein [Deltaproteobacteria bacterium]|nr:nucleotidyltransferase domain-containing protein [Deltaproteobacteria bacterium]